jgi:hypothetical protein
MGVTLGSRYRDVLSGMFKRAMRLGLVASNPVRGMPKLREAGRRLLFVPFDGAEESALREALAIDLRRFSRSAPTLDSVEGAELGALSEGTFAKRCFAADAMNSIVRSVLLDLTTQRGARRSQGADLPRSLSDRQLVPQNACETSLHGAVIDWNEA